MRRKKRHYIAAVINSEPRVLVTSDWRDGIYETWVLGIDASHAIEIAAAMNVREAALAARRRADASRPKPRGGN